MKYLENILKEIRDNKNQILDDFAKAYLAETGLNPSEVEMVEQFDHAKMTYVYSFRKKSS